MMYLKKKSISIISLILLIAIAFVINYTYQNESNKETGGKNQVTNTSQTEKSKSLNTSSTNTSSKALSGSLTSGLFASYREEREINRSRSLDALKEIVNNKNTTKETRDQAQNQIIKLTEVTQKEMAIENLIKAKGFQDAVVLIDNDTANVIVQADKLSEQEVAQIQDIVTRQTGISIDNIKIMNRIN